MAKSNSKKSKRNDDLNPFIVKKSKKLAKKLKPQSHTNTEFKHRQILLPDQRIDNRKNVTFKDCTIQLKNANAKIRANGLQGIKHLIKNFNPRNKYGLMDLFDCLFPLVMDRDSQIRNNLYETFKDFLLKSSNLLQCEKIANKFGAYILTAMCDINHVVGIDSLRFLSLCISNSPNAAFCINNFEKIMKNYFYLLKIPASEIEAKTAQPNLIKKRYVTTIIKNQDQYSILESIDFYIEKMFSIFVAKQKNGDSTKSRYHDTKRFMASQIYNDALNLSQGSSHSLPEACYKMFYLMFYYSQSLLNDKKEILDKLSYQSLGTADVDLELKILQLSINVLCKTYCISRSCTDTYSIDYKKSLSELILRFPITCSSSNQFLKDLLRRINDSILDIFILVHENNNSVMTNQVSNPETREIFENFYIEYVVDTIKEHPEALLERKCHVLRNFLVICSVTSIEKIISSILLSPKLLKTQQEELFKVVCENTFHLKHVEFYIPILEKISLVFLNNGMTGLYLIALNAFRKLAQRTCVICTSDEKKTLFSIYTTMINNVLRITDPKSFEIKLKLIRMGYMFIDYNIDFENCITSIIDTTDTTCSHENLLLKREADLVISIIKNI